MPETTLPPCPVCGGEAELTECTTETDEAFVCCRAPAHGLGCLSGPSCPTTAEAIAAWRRLADAARLADAVGRLEGLHTSGGEVIVRGNMHSDWPLRAATLAAALIALAEEVGDGRES